jgi:hypothetical protein
MRRTSCPVHHVRGPLVRAEEENLGLVVQVHQRFLDSRDVSGKKKVDDSLCKQTISSV